MLWLRLLLHHCIPFRSGWHHRIKMVFFFFQSKLLLCVWEKEKKHNSLDSTTHSIQHVLLYFVCSYMHLERAPATSTSTNCIVSLLLSICYSAGQLLVVYIVCSAGKIIHIKLYGPANSKNLHTSTHTPYQSFNISIFICFLKNCHATQFALALENNFIYLFSSRPMDE